MTKFPRILAPALAAGAILGFALVVPAIGQQGGRPLHAVLVGETEVPGPGDPNASGLAEVTLNQGQGRVCYDIASVGLTNVVMGHIHKGPAGVAGPIVVHFVVTADGQASDCAEADKALVKDIRQNPEGYYVNLHTSALPKGAIRGQLQKGGGD